MNTLLPPAALLTLLAAVMPGQVPTPTPTPTTPPTPAAALARAQLIERTEGDLAAAKAAYQALLDDPAAAAVHAEAALGLGALLWRLDQTDAARQLLDRAAAAGGEIGRRAQELLAGKGPEAAVLEEQLHQARLLRDRLKELLERPRDDKGDLGPEDRTAARTVERELRALGPAASSVLVQYLRPQGSRAEPHLQPTVDGKPNQPLRAFAELLWEIGHRPAERFLLGVAADGDLPTRVFYAAAANRTVVAPDLRPTLVRFAEIPDPSGEIWSSIRTRFSAFPVERLLELIQAEHPGHRAAGLSGLAEVWPQLSLSRRAEVPSTHGEAIRRAARDGNRRVQESAWLLLRQCAVVGPANASLLLLSELPSLPPGTRLSLSGAGSVAIDDAWFRAAADAAERIGPVDFLQGRDEGRPCDALLDLVSNPGHQRWTRAGVDCVVRLLELGYGKGLTSPTRASWCGSAVAAADEGQFARLVATIPLHRERYLAEAMQRQRLPAVAFPALRRILDRELQQPTIPWLAEPRSGERMFAALLRWAAGSGLNDAASWLGEIAARRPEHASTCTLSLCDMLLAAPPCLAACGPLRQLMVLPGAGTESITAAERGAAFAALVRAGDAAAIPLLLQAYRLGLAPLVGDGVPAEWQGRRGIRLLCEQPDTKGMARWHGFGDTELRAAWTALLADDVLDLVAGDFDDVPGAAAQSEVVPVAVLDLLVPRLPALHARVKNFTGQGRLIYGFRRLESPIAPAVAAALQALMRGQHADLAARVLGFLPPAVTIQFADDGRRILQQAPLTDVLDNLLNGGLVATDDDWRTWLASREDNLVRRAIAVVPADAARRVWPQVVALLRHPSDRVVSDAASLLARTDAAAAATEILAALWHNDGATGELRTLLKTLREDNEQRGYWQQASSGIDASPKAALTRLLVQAKAGEPKEQRLLALRSLAALGAPEALPYLIDAVRDGDAEIAAAARASLTAIYERSGVEPQTK